MLFQIIDILGHGLQKLSLAWSFNCFIEGRCIRVSLINIDHLRDINHHTRHEIVHQAKLWVHNQSMDVLKILRPTREFQVPDHPGIHPLDHGVAIFLIKLQLNRGSPLSTWTPMSHWFHCIPWNCLPWICILWSWGTWHGLPWRGLPCNWLTYGSWGGIGVLYMSKVLI